MSTLVGPERPGDPDLDDLRTRVTDLNALLGTRAEELAQVRTALDAFGIRYRHEVGTLHEQLDALEYAIAEAELGELSRDVEAGRTRSAAAVTDENPAPARFTTDAVRKLFRDVAKAVHPDLAHDAEARERRHALMVEANRAYALGDEEQLRSILQAWERSPEAVRGSDPEATRLRLERRVAVLEEELASLERDLSELHASPLWALKTMVDEAATRGKDLVGDMVKRLQRDIMAARNRLDAMTGGVEIGEQRRRRSPNPR